MCSVQCNCFFNSALFVQDKSSASYCALYSVECNCFLNSALFVQDKNKALDDTPPFFDLSSLKSRTFQIILLSTFVSSFGIFTPLLLLVSKHLQGQYNFYAGIKGIVIILCILLQSIHVSPFFNLYG